MAKFKTLG